MIKLHSFGKKFNVADPSPYVLKVHVFMRMAGIEFEEDTDSANLRKAPKGKLPFLTDGDQIIADSEFILDYLTKKYQIELDSALSETQKQQAYLISKSLDENFYWCMVYSRWAIDDTWVHLKKAFFSGLPFPVKYFLPKIIRKSVLKTLYKQGISRHSKDEIKTIMDKSLHALSVLLGEQKYFYGDHLVTFDATAFAFLSECIDMPFNNEFNDLALGYPNLVNYCERINKLYYRE